MGQQLEPIQSNYTAGELDPQLAAREDGDIYYSGAERARNVLLIPHGGCTRRPGLIYRDTLVPAIETVDLTAGGIVVTAPEGGTAATAIDGDDTTKMTTTTNIGTVDPYVILHVDLGAAFSTPIRFADVRNISTDGAFIEINDEVRIQWSDDDAAWNDLEAAFEFVTDEDSRWNYRRAFTTPAVHRYWRVVRIGSTDGGTRKFELGQFKLWVDTSPTLLSASRLMQFEATTENTYLVVATDQNARIYRNGARQADVSIPHTAAQLQETAWTQSLDTMILFNNDVQPHVIRRLGGDTKWRDGVQAFSNIPTFDFNDQGLGAEPVWASVAFMTGTIIRGWPRCGTFFKGRLYMGGTRDLSQTYWASAAQGDLFDFDDGGGSPAADSSFTVTMDTDEAADIYHLEPGDFLFIITGSGPFYQGPRDDPPTPDNVTVQRVRGKKRARGPGFRAFQLDTGIVYLDDSGEQVNEIVETVFRGRFEVNNLAFLAPHLIRDPQDIALRRSLSTDRGDLLLLANSDGSLAVLQTLRNRDFTGWTGWHAGKGSADLFQGKFLQVGTQVGGINGRYFAVVERTIDGALVRTLEEFLDNSFLDASVTIVAQFDQITATAGQALYSYTFASPADLGDNPKAQLRPNADATLFKTFVFAANLSPQVLSNYEIPAGLSANSTLLVGVVQEDASMDFPTGVTFGPTPMVEITQFSAANNNIAWYRLDNPTPGLTDNITVTLGGPAQIGTIIAMVVENIDLTVAPIIVTDTAGSGTSLDENITSVEDNTLVISALNLSGVATSAATGTGHSQLFTNTTSPTGAATQSFGQALIPSPATELLGYSWAPSVATSVLVLLGFQSIPSGDIADLTVRKNKVLLEQGVDYFVDLAAQTITLSAAQAALVVAGDIIRIAENIRTVTGLDHVEGEQLKVRANDAVATPQTVASGSITLFVDDLADERVEVGLDFPDVKEVLVNELMIRNIDPLTEEEARFEVFADSDGVGAGDTVLLRDMPMAVPPGAGIPTIRGRKMRVHTATIVISNTQGFAFGANDIAPEPIVLQETGDFVLDRRPPYRSQTIRVRNLQGWTLDGQTEITQRDPVPMTILSVSRRALVA